MKRSPLLGNSARPSRKWPRPEPAAARIIWNCWRCVACVVRLFFDLAKEPRRGTCPHSILVYSSGLAAPDGAKACGSGDSLMVATDYQWHVRPARVFLGGGQRRRYLALAGEHRLETNRPCAWSAPSQLRHAKTGRFPACEVAPVSSQFSANVNLIVRRAPPERRFLLSRTGGCLADRFAFLIPAWPSRSKKYW